MNLENKRHIIIHKKAKDRANAKTNKTMKNLTEDNVFITKI